MKIELNAGESGMKLLFSNIGTKNEDEFYLLMAYHKSRKGGFGYKPSIERCKKVLAAKGYKYINYDDIKEGSC